ncbi:S8 family serine peptidase [Streptomyces sp. NBC_01077]|uniref:S8 family serine peptidase n=1 Tax=Streptomyces sp. NBC_01077 TaxID=2903746 RepID=UPI00386E7FE5|nr:S8 family serine peptidase [Streptomyces sp. NBC_01077]WSV43571.1 S8 family serine peptidase [Streptomyces sp. NBC_01077]
MSEQDGSGVKPGNGTSGARPGNGGKGVKPGGVQSGMGTPSRAAGPPAGGRSEERREPAAPQSRAQDVRLGWGRYLVAPRPVGLLAVGVPPIEASALFALLEEDPDVEPVAQVRPSRSHGLGAIAEPHPACPPVAVVAMPDERARALAANPQVVVEIDQPLSYAPIPVLGSVSAVPLLDPMLAVPLEEPEHIRVLVTGSDGDVLTGAHVWAVGAASAHGVTGRDGRVSLRLSADTPATLQSLYVRPVSGYWPLRIDRPCPTGGSGEITVEVQALAETFEGFPGRAVTGWGIQAMRLHQLPPTYRGHGIKIALLDSGVNTSHPDLKDTVQAGRDFTGPDGAWQSDATGHGTWCAGVIAAADNHSGITGIAAEAELHALKLFPGGRVSDLLQAVDYCIAHDIDIAQISLAYTVPSQLVAWKLMDAHAAGITVIAPAGDTAGPVTHPADLPGVLSVGAIAHTGAYPARSPLEATRPPWPGFYPAPFTPAGPDVDLVAPGTAIITTALGDGYTPADGTAIAAAHVTGLAALLLAHHDHLRTQAIPRTPARAGHLLALLRIACRPLPGTDPTRLGAGIADAPTALGTPALWQPEHGTHPMYAAAGGPYLRT